jgi:hypothetical protein
MRLTCRQLWLAQYLDRCEGVNASTSATARRGFCRILRVVLAPQDPRCIAIHSYMRFTGLNYA